MNGVRPGLDDGGVLLLARRQQSWVMLNLAGEAVYRADDIAAGDTDAACRWAHQIAVSIAGTAPKPTHSIVGVHCYTFHEHAGRIEARLAPGRLHHDGHGWVLVNHDGEIEHRNDSIGRDDQRDADLWADAMYRAAAPRRRWRVNVGVFPDGSYFDRHGVLGRQRARRAWNRMLDWARI